MMAGGSQITLKEPGLSLESDTGRSFGGADHGS